MEDELIDIVDEKGKIIGKTTRGEAYEKALLHPAVHVAVFDSRRRLLIQQRSSQKSIFPLYWDISVGEHRKPAESFKAAAIRGLAEELSIKLPFNLTEIRGKHVQKSDFQRDGRTFKEYELVVLYGTIYDGRIEIDPEEVKEVRFVYLAQLKDMTRSNQFTPWGLEEIKTLLKNPEIDKRLR